MAYISVNSTTIKDPSTASGFVDLSISYRKLLALLLSGSVGLINATVANRDSIDAGTAVYYLNRRNLTQNYLNSYSLGPNDTTAIRTVQVTLDQAKEINYEYETLDIKRLGAKFVDGGIDIGDAFVSGWLDAKAKSVEVYLVAKLLQLGVNTAVANTLINLTLPGSPTVNDYRQQVWLPIVQTLANLKAQVTDEYIGTNADDFYLWVSPAFKNYILLATTNLGSDISTRSLMDGRVTEIGGIKLVESTFLAGLYTKPATTTTYPYNNALDKNETFNFQSCDAILIHKEALAFPFNMGQQNLFILQGNGNIKNFHKFLVNSNGGVALRPGLVKGFKLINLIPLNTIITTTVLGNIVTGTGAPAPTVTQLEGAITAVNASYIAGMATFATPAPTTTTATATPNGTTTDGSPIVLTYTVSAT